MDELRHEIARRTVQLPGGWCELGRRTGIDRTVLYRAFMMHGKRPTLVTLLAVAPHVGLKVALVEQ